MAKVNLSERALDVLNRAHEMKRDNDFCGKDGGLPREMQQFMEWLGEHLRSVLEREAWEQPHVVRSDEGVELLLCSPTWRRSDHDYVAFSFWWPNLNDELPCIELYVPAEDRFPARNGMLDRLRPTLKQSGFTDYYELGDPDPSYPIWKNIPLEKFHRESGFDLPSFVEAVVDGFQQLMKIEPLIEDAFQSGPEKPLPRPSDRPLRTIAFLDTESKGSGNARTMTELAIVNVAYDADGDTVVGILEEYCMNAGQTLDETEARSVLERADFIVAHNSAADRPLLDRHLPGTERTKWLCSLHGIKWKQLLRVQSESLQTLLGKTGLRYEQDHNARADAHDLRRLLSVKHQGRTYLGRLIDSTQTKDLLDSSSDVPRDQQLT